MRPPIPPRPELGADTRSVFAWETLGRPVAMEALWTTTAILEAAGITAFDARMWYGLPGQRERGLCETIDELLDHGARHIRLQDIPLTPGTPFERHFVQHEAVLKLARNDLELPSNDQRALLAQAGAAHLATRELLAYAPACFARPSDEQRFDTLRAQGCDFVELGCAGSSQVDGLRTRNITDMRRYVAHAHDPAAIVATVEDFTLPWARRREHL